MTADAIRIRPARQSDLGAVRACVDAAYAVWVPRIGRKPSPMLADYRALIDEGAVYLVPDEPGAAAVLVLRPSDEGLLIENVAVHPSRQRRGLGSRLLTFAEEQAHALGLPELRLYTHELMTENQRFYAARGFVETERRTEHGFARVYMVRSCRRQAIGGRR